MITYHSFSTKYCKACRKALRAVKTVIKHLFGWFDFEINQQLRDFQPLKNCFVNQF